jgi:hypothetical protein
MSLAVLAVARGKRESFDFGFAFPYFIEFQELSGVDVETEMTSFAINFSGASFYTDTAGAGVYANLIFPQNLKLSASGQSVSARRSDYDFLMALDALFGPAFMLYKDDKFSVPLAAGIHLMRLWSVADAGSTDGTSFGLGANITGEHHFNKKIYLFTRIQLTLDIFAVTKTEEYVAYYTYYQTNSGGLINLGVNASMGMGFLW